MKKNLTLLAVVIVVLSGCEPQTDTSEAKSIPKISVVEETQVNNDGEQKASETNKNVEITYNDYNITLNVNPDTGIIKGSQKVTYINKSQDRLDEICFNLSLNAFAMESTYQPFFNEHKNKIFPNSREYGYMTVISAMCNGNNAEFDVNGTALAIVLENGLYPSETAEINIVFEAYIPKMNHRTGSNDYAMWLGGFLPILAVYENGEWRLDDYYPAGDPFYSETANYTVTISAPNKYNVVGTGVESVKEAEDKKTTVITAKLVRDFAFAVLDRNYREIRLYTKDGVEINLYYHSEIDNVDNFILNAEKALDYYSTYVGSYPYRQIDIIETGMFLSGGMEFSQVIFIDGEYLDKPATYNTLVHEIGHQWFYNIVGNDQIHYPWLDEGLVSMLQEKVIFSNVEDLPKFQQKFEWDYNNLEKLLPNQTNLKISESLGDYKNWSSYYNIQYTKAKLMFYSLYLKLGEEKFHEFIQTYYTLYSFKNATPQDLIETAELVYGESLEEFFDSWLEGDELPPLYK